MIKNKVRAVLQKVQLEHHVWNTALLHATVLYNRTSPHYLIEWHHTNFCVLGLAETTTYDISIWCVCACEITRRGDQFSDRATSGMYRGLRNGMFHVYTQKRKVLVTIKQVGFDETISALWQGVGEEEQMVLSCRSNRNHGWVIWNYLKGNLE